MHPIYIKRIVQAGKRIRLAPSARSDGAEGHVIDIAHATADSRKHEQRQYGFMQR